MLRLVVGLTLTVALLSGCLSKDASRADMEEQAADAIAKFRQDVLPGGRLSSVDVPNKSQISVESTAPGFPVKFNAGVKGHVDLGPGGEVLLTATVMNSMKFTGYCDAQHVVTITENTEEADIPEGRIESRNWMGVCSGPGSEELLLRAFEFQLVDPVLFTGQIDTEQMTAVSFEDTGKKKLVGEYLVDGPEGATTLFITVHGDKVMQIIAKNPDSHIVMDMTYGERMPVEKPAADAQVPSPVSGDVTIDDDGWHWRGIERPGMPAEGGPIGEYSLSVYENGATVSCASVSKSPIVTFDLGGSLRQEQSGWRLIITPDEDGTLGMGDELLVSQPNSIVQEFDHVVVIHDDWAGTPAMLGCATPGPGIGLGALGLLGAVLVAARRRL